MDRRFTFFRADETVYPAGQRGKSILDLIIQENLMLKEFILLASPGTKGLWKGQFFEEAGIHSVNPCKKLFIPENSVQKRAFFYFSGKQGENIAQHFT